MSEPEPGSGPSHAERMSNVQGVTLLDDEELLFDTHPSWYGRITKRWIWATVLTLGFAWLYLWYPAWKHRRACRRTRYVITSERIIEKDGGGMFGTAQTNEYPIRDITDIQTHASWLEQQFGVGTVSFREHDGATSAVELTSVPNYEEIASTMSGYQRREEEKFRQPHYGER